MSGQVGDGGRVSVFLAVALTALLAIIGLSYDAAGQVRAGHTAQLLAAEAARAAGQAVDRDELLATGRSRADPAAAVQAAQDYLQRAGAVGTVEIGADRTWITVTVDDVYEPVFLSFFGAADRPVTGTATATIVSG